VCVCVCVFGEKIWRSFFLLIFLFGAEKGLVCLLGGCADGTVCEAEEGCQSQRGELGFEVYEAEARAHTWHGIV